MKETQVIDLQINASEGNESVIFIDSSHPMISWKIQTDIPDFRQSAYRIIAKNESEQMVWDSGMVPGSESKWIPWGGNELKIGERISLRVQITAENGELSPFSAPVFFERAPDHNEYWGNARWIWYDRNNYSTTAPSPYFRREFEVKSGLKRAVLFITARGVFEASLDGKRFTRDLLAPGWTDFKQQIPFMSYDLTESLPPGKHCLGGILADGWCCGNLTIFRIRNHYHEHPELLAWLELRYEDGRKESIVTDHSWKMATGPILASDLYDGETYDARQEIHGWNVIGFDDSRWTSACEGESVRNSPVLVPRTAPPVRYMQDLSPVRILNPKKDTYIWDFGQNFTGTFRVAGVRGVKGRLYSFRTGEMLEKDGSLYTLNYRSAKSQDYYICRGPLEEAETYIPHFTFHGFRYLQIDGFQFDGLKPHELEVTGLVMHSDMKLKGDFSCGNELVTRLWKNVVWGQRGNFLEIPTDCPQRDERLGWTGDAQLFAPTAMLNMDCCTFYRKYLRDIRDAVSSDGAAPSIAPAILNMRSGAAAWGDAIVLIPFELYRHYGWKSILTENYDAMKRSIDWQKNHSEGLIRPSKDNFGDWLAPDPPPVELVATAYFAHCTQCISEIAGILGYPEDKRYYAELGNDIVKAFRKQFMDEHGIVRSDTQSALVFTLAFNLAAPEHVKANASKLEDAIRSNGTRISTGFLGTGLILPALARHGLARTACDLLLQENYPSWLFSVKHGATTMWERWDSYTDESGFGNVSMNSFNHYAYGTVASFLIEELGGIHYSHQGISLRIIPDSRFSPVHAVYDSPYGRIVSDWQTDDAGKLNWQVEVPAGIPAQAALPDGTITVLNIGKNILA